MTTYTNVGKFVGEALAALPEARPSSRRFYASNGVNYTDRSYDLPDGSHLELGVRSPQGSCEYLWLLYSPAGTICNDFAPTPRGYHTGRPSDLDAETWRHFQSALSAAEAKGGWSLKYEVKTLYEATWAPITPEQIEANRERAAALRSGR